MRLTTPGPTVGVVGGGQLGRMLGEAAGPLGVEVVVCDPTPDCPAAPVVRDQVVGEYGDYETVCELGERADVLTVEIELADPETLQRVSERTDTPVHPAPETIRITSDKLLEKRRLAEAGVPVPDFRRVDDADDLRRAGEDLGWPVVCKARTGGYDGRGTVPVDGPEEVDRAASEIAGPALAEAMVEFERELAVVGVRGDGETGTFPVTETVHESEILRETVSPPRTDRTTRSHAREVARDVLDVLEGRGVFGIELFETGDPSGSGSGSGSGDGDGDEPEILVNEIAPRPHNSGHWTIEGCLTSQFAQHVRAVLGWPLGATDRRCPAVTANVLGDESDPRPAELDGVERVLAAPDATLHWYGKREVRPLRKMGHITLVGDTDEEDGDIGEASAGTAGTGADLLGRARALRDGLTFE